MKSPALPHKERNLKPEVRNPGIGRSRRVSVSHQEIQLRAYHKWETGQAYWKGLKNLVGSPTRVGAREINGVTATGSTHAIMQCIIGLAKY